MLRVALRHTLGDFQLDVAFESPADGITALFGPSGAGKSATLAAIGGTIAPAHGHITLGDRVLLDTAAGLAVPPQRRRIGWVHQDARLFPHMPVRANLRYGQRRAAGRATIAEADVLAALGIAHLLDRRVAELSGGERQRVALGRALLSQPDLLLLDEPLAALDAARRQEVLGFILRLKHEFRLPMVYVTHDPTEVRALADHIVRLDHGRSVGTGFESLDSVSLEAVVINAQTARTSDGHQVTIPLDAFAPGNTITIEVRRQTQIASSPRT